MREKFGSWGVRLEGFLREEGVFVEGLKKCLDKFRELNKNLETLKTKAGLEEVEELVNLRLEDKSNVIVKETPTSSWHKRD